MKKICFAVVVLLLSIPAMAQFGIKGGLNFASLNGSDADAFDGLTSFHIGLVKEISVFDNLSIQPELLYSTQGAKIDQPDGDEDNYKLNYLTLPVLLKFYLNNEFSIHGGPQVAVLLGETKNVAPIDTNTFDYGFAAGLEYAITKGFFVQGRYYYGGLTEITDDADIKNSVIQLSLGFKF